MRLIDADALREEAIKAQNREDTNSYINMGLARAVELIAKAPTIEERPKGKWQYTTHYARRYRICPFCKCEKEDDRSAGWFYCYHCGADMRGEE